MRPRNVYADVEFFKMLAEKLAAFAGLREGQRVLDVATGRGALAFTASAAVGPRGWVDTIDIADRMVSLTRESAQSPG